MCGLTNRPPTKQAGRGSTASRAGKKRRLPVGTAFDGRPLEEGDAAPGPAGRHHKLRCAALFLDIQKAFDRVDHDILLARLHGMGVRNAAWRWVRSFLSNRRMRCVGSQHESHWQPVQYGVPQGCVLSPLLFLVFINDLIVTLATRDDCRLIAPCFYADDGVLGPHLGRCHYELRRRLKWSTDAFERQYAAHLAAAARHLDEWCARSRMRFGQEKTQIVVFDRSKQHSGTQLFEDVQLCGYTVQVAGSYEYLGLTLTSDLEWNTHAKRKLAVARTAAARVTAVALNARPVNPAIVRELVRSCVMPAYDYGIEFWGNGQPEATQRAFQAVAARPLRAALGLPVTTHQHSVLHAYGIPAWHTHLQHRQLQLGVRASHIHQTDPAHPTARLFDLFHNTLGTEHRRLLAVNVTLPLPVRITTCLLPYVSLTDDQPIDTEQPLLTSPTQWSERQQRARTHAASDVCSQKRRSLYGRRRARTWMAFSSLHRQPQAAEADNAHDAIRREHSGIRKVRADAAHAEWRETHMPATQAERDALKPTDRNRRTTAPIAQCLDGPATDSGPRLRFLRPRYTHLLTQPDVVRRCRMLFGRSCTATVRNRFPSSRDAAATSQTCTCGVDSETIPHLLLHCPHYAAARTAVTRTLASCGLQLLPASVLCPPERGRRQYEQLYTATSSYLASVDGTRRRLGLPHLDNGPVHQHDRSIPQLPPPAPPAPAAAHPPAAPLVALAAAVPLDTG